MTDDTRLAGRLRFSHLRLLLALERGRSLRAAAEELSLTQPALSKALKGLESILGMPLFLRSPQGLRTTAEGRVMMRGAAVLMKELMHVRDEARVMGGGTGVLRVGAPPFVALGYVPAVIERALSRAARSGAALRIRLLEDSVPRLLDALLAGDLDALLTTYSSRMQDAEHMHGFASVKLYEETYQVIAAHSHLLFRKRTVRWEDLARERWILPAEGGMLGEVTREAFLRAGIAPPAPHVESTSPLTNVKLVAQGIGLSVVPNAMIQESPHGRAVRKLRVVPPLPGVSVVLLHRESVAEHPRLLALKEALRIEAAAQAAR